MRPAVAAPLVALLALFPLASAVPAGADSFTPTADAVTTPPYGTLSPGTPIGGDVPLAGDWDGDGTTTTGVRRIATFYLRNSNTTGQADLSFDYGASGDRPLAGDWDGDGVTTVGVRRGARFYLRNSNTAGVADVTVDFGFSDDFPVSGDWDGDGTTTIGVFRQGTFYLRNSNMTGPADIVVDFGQKFVDQPIVGDWDGNGATTVGVYGAEPIFGGIALFWRNMNTAGAAEGISAIGLYADTGLSGDWDGDGVDTVGLRRRSSFYLSNSNAVSTASIVFDYGEATLSFG